ncbi:SRPBCC family protein [Antrihabitans cavernicola]|uniref:SRPBCC family protein n=1 Tax=Antrihabitans cavernicola TaxID=2495913 RepID=A0A5A7S708_9NOCA|nr:SRPBCC family protein [Spelaeibacter cavernicola]KAA0018446.1 SRPBCC family protein [Spelaeibacter cavernicola]
MRYRDCPTVEVAVRVVATPAAVWSLVSDIGFPVSFSTELQSVEWLSGATTLAVGNRFRGNNVHPALGNWSTDSEVIEVEEGRRWVWQVENWEGKVSATWGFEVDPGRDAVTVRQWARMGPAPSGLSGAIAQMPDKEARIVANRLDEWRDGMSRNLAGIQEALAAG